jgi:dCMP deaminase
MDWHEATGPGSAIYAQQQKWDRRYLRLAEQVSTWSKDPSSKIGAVAIGHKGQVLSQGYNGFARGIREDLTPRWENKEWKYKFIVHAEMNAIYNATYNGVSLDGSTLYIWGLPCCSDCAKGVIQVGVKRVVMPKKDYPERWIESFKLSETMFREAGVEFEFVDVEDV